MITRILPKFSIFRLPAAEVPACAPKVIAWVLFRLLLSILLAVSTWSCAPTTWMYGSAPSAGELQMIANMPKDQALTFLRSLYVPETANSCRFEEDSVLRWQKGTLLPGEVPYKSLYFSGLSYDRRVVRLVLSVRGTNELWCLMHPKLLAEHQGKNAEKMINHICQALTVMGTRDIPLSEFSRILQSPSQSWGEARESVGRREP